MICKKYGAQFRSPHSYCISLWRTHSCYYTCFILFLWRTYYRSTDSVYNKWAMRFLQQYCGESRVLWHVTPCCWFSTFRCFKGIQCLQLRGLSGPPCQTWRWRQCVPSKQKETLTQQQTIPYHVCNSQTSSTSQNINTYFMFYMHTKIYKPRFNAHFCTAALVLFYISGDYHFNKSCTFFQNVLPYTISGS